MLLSTPQDNAMVAKPYVLHVLWSALTQLYPSNPFAMRRGFRILKGAAMTAVLAPEGAQSLVTVHEASNLCGVGAGTVRQWASRGYGPTGHKSRLAACGLDERGRKLYRLLDVAKAEHATRTLARR